MQSCNRVRVGAVDFRREGYKWRGRWRTGSYLSTCSRPISERHSKPSFLHPHKKCHHLMGVERTQWQCVCQAPGTGPMMGSQCRVLNLLTIICFILIIQSYWPEFESRHRIKQTSNSQTVLFQGNGLASWPERANISAVTQVTVPWKTHGDKSPLQQSPRRRNKLIKLPNGEGRVDLLLISLLLYYPFEKHPLTEITNWRLCGGKSHLSITVVTLPHLSF